MMECATNERSVIKKLKLGVCELDFLSLLGTSILSESISPRRFELYVEVLGELTLK